MNEQLNEAHLLVKNLIQHKQKYNEILNRSLTISSSSSSSSTTTKIINNQSTASKVNNNKTQHNGGYKSKIPISKNNSKINKKITNISNR